MIDELIGAEAVGVGRVFCKPNAGQLTDIRDQIEAGKLVAHVRAVFPLSEIREALDLSERGHARQNRPKCYRVGLKLTLLSGKCLQLGGVPTVCC